MYGDEDDFYDPEEYAWAEERKKINKKPDDYLEIEKMELRDSFGIMEDFANVVDNVKTAQPACLRPESKKAVQ